MSGAISFNNFVEIKSAPLLSLGFNCLHVYKISISEILENFKEFSFLSVRKVSKEISESPISSASFGPTPAKNVLNSFAMSK